MSGATETTTADGVKIDADGVIVQDDKQITTTIGDNSDYKVFDYRINCAEYFGKVLVGASKERCASILNNGAHEFLFTFVAFNLIQVPEGMSLFSDKFKKDKEFGHIIGIDDKGRIFSAYCKSYALGAFKDMIDGYLFDLTEGKAKGGLIGKQMLLSMGALVRSAKGNHFEPSIKIVEGEHVNDDKAAKVAEMYRNRTLNHTPATFVKI
jgi:hypothetical protein